jgi:integrase
VKGDVGLHVVERKLGQINRVRIGEIRRIRLCDVDWENRTLTIPLRSERSKDGRPVQPSRREARGQGCRESERRAHASAGGMRRRTEPKPLLAIRHPHKTLKNSVPIARIKHSDLHDDLAFENRLDQGELGKAIQLEAVFS